jgi:hypothetical protein
MNRALHVIFSLGIILAGCSMPEQPKIAIYILERQPNLLVELPQRQQPAIAAQLGVRGFDNDGQLVPKIEGRLPSSLYTHNRPPFPRQDLSTQQVRRGRRLSILGNDE